MYTPEQHIALFMQVFTVFRGFPGGSEVKASASNAGDLSSIPGSGRSPGEGNGNPLQCSHLENPMDGKAWWAAVHRVAESAMTERPHFTCTVFKHGVCCLFQFVF